jgi:endonuclease/exonuclease/phosphatase family metal-dependent hydrolase
MRLSALTINVQNRQGDPRRTELLNGQLRRLAPDLVAFQEVVDPAHLEALIAGTGLHGTHQTDVLGYEPPYADRYGGTAVATRWPHRVVEAIDQSLPGDPLPWYALALAVPVPDAGELLLIAPTSSVHLDAEAARERQALAIADLDERHRRTLPTIIAGDFNATPDSAGIRFLSGLQTLDGRSVHYHDSWAVAGDGPGHTWSVDNPLTAAEIEILVAQPNHRRRIDYVFVGTMHKHPDGRARILSAEVVLDRPVDGVWLSDHAGVLVELDVRSAS